MDGVESDMAIDQRGMLLSEYLEGQQGGHEGKHGSHGGQHDKPRRAAWHSAMVEMARWDTVCTLYSKFKSTITVLNNLEIKKRKIVATVHPFTMELLKYTN